MTERTIRREDARLLTGGGRYTADWNLPGQAYAFFLRSDRAHAEIVSIDAEAASARKGVHLVLTGADYAGENEMDAFARARGLSVDRDDLGVCTVGAQEKSVGLSGQVPVRGVATSAGEQAR